MSRIYAYLRASTKEQDAGRAKQELMEFTKEQGTEVAAWFVENESGASLQRPELFRLLDIAQRGDVLLVEQVDRLSRLNANDWQELRAIIDSKGIRIVALDLPTSHQLIKSGDEFTSRMLEALNSMMLDMLAAISNKDYADRRRRQAQGIKNNKDSFKGRPVNTELHAKIRELLEAGFSYTKIMEHAGCSRATIATVSKKMKEVAEV
ncbi:recombinase family protein [Oceanisphaera sp. IT1-181]|uniref:recombinase family protein n=1 Tax=Oceanisphaera sp. IT1-181 TaxID=3081199 RepID=UPI0029CA7D9F|nr:recombinase family protein [Oceanisphaera sp. IT1-181]